MVFRIEHQAIYKTFIYMLHRGKTDSNRVNVLDKVLSMTVLLDSVILIEITFRIDKPASLLDQRPGQEIPTSSKSSITA